jgi:hypothetical protein
MAQLVATDRKDLEERMIAAAPSHLLVLVPVAVAIIAFFDQARII